MRNKGRRAPCAGQIGFGLLGFACILLLLTRADSAVIAAGHGLSLCTRTVIPALFPFMVCSELLVASGGATLLGRALARPMQAVLGVPGAAACPVLLGALCGFPVGARAVAALYDQGALTARQCTRLLTFINNPSSAYLISAVGVSLLGSRRLGLLLLGTSLFLSFVTALVTRPLFGKQEPTPMPQADLQVSADVFVGAVSSAAGGMLSVCALVVFFSAILGAARDLIGELPQEIFALVYGAVELSGGMAEAAKISDPIKAAMACAFLSGWSGLSVLCQIGTACRGRGIRLLPYVIAKLVQGVLGAAVVGLCVRYFFPLLPPENVHAGLLLPGGATVLLAGAVNLAFLAGCGLLAVRQAKPMHRKRDCDIY